MRRTVSVRMCGVLYCLYSVKFPLFWIVIIFIACELCGFYTAFCVQTLVFCVVICIWISHTHLFILLTRKWHENKRVSRDKNSTTGRYINRYRFNFQVAIPLDCVFAVKLLFSNIQMEILRQENIQMFVIMHQSEMNSFIYYFFF